MKIDVLTLFPELFTQWQGNSIIKNAQESAKFILNLVDLKGFSDREDGRVDDRPFGGGPGMVFKPKVVIDALRSVKSDKKSIKIHLSPSGTPWTQKLAEEFSQQKHLIILCSRYEGVDQRALDIGGFEDISIGDYVCMGGEIPAMALLESVIRLIPGVLGHKLSALEDSFSPGRDGLLDCPHYTRPAEFEGHKVPNTLLSGHHEKIKEWREKMAYQRSVERRKDLLQ